MRCVVYTSHRILRGHSLGDASQQFDHISSHDGMNIKGTWDLTTLATVVYSIIARPQTWRAPFLTCPHHFYYHLALQIRSLYVLLLLRIAPVGQHQPLEFCFSMSSTKRRVSTMISRGVSEALSTAAPGRWTPRPFVHAADGSGRRSRVYFSLPPSKILLLGPRRVLRERLFRSRARLHRPRLRRPGW